MASLILPVAISLSDNVLVGASLSEPHHMLLVGLRLICSEFYLLLKPS